MNQKFKITAMLVLLCGVFLQELVCFAGDDAVLEKNNGWAAAESERWSLEKSVKRTIEISPGILSKAAELTGREGDLIQAGAWPNPGVELSGSSKLGIDDSTGGVDLTQVALSQPVPLGRLGHQRVLARARFEAAKQNLFFQQLRQEAETASRFHLLQMMEKKLEQANEQLAFAESYQKNDHPHSALADDPLVRYLTPLEQKRLDIMRAVASQAVATAEGEYSEAVSGFKVLLQLPDEALPKAEALKTVEWQEPIEGLMARQEERHPMIVAAQLEEEAAKAGIKLARGELLTDPTLRLFGERDFLDGKRHNFYGASVHLQLPVWDRKKGLVTRAKSDSQKAGYDLEAIRQELHAQLRQTHLHLGHLMDQAKDYQSEILTPAKEVFELTKNAFAAGEVNVLSIIDANTTYFDAERHYLELLYQAWIELAELRFAAGISLLGEMTLGNEKSRGGRS